MSRDTPATPVQATLQDQLAQLRRGDRNAQTEAPPAQPFEREPRYMVMKLKDAHGSLSLTEQLILDALFKKVLAHRQRQCKAPLQGVFVEHDWPEYEPTWAAIEARVRGRDLPPALTALAEAAAPLMQWLNARSNPHTTVIVTPTSAEALEAIHCVHTDKFLRD